MRRVAGVELIALAVLAISAPASAQQNDPKTFRDWLAGCDNIKSCTALSLPAEAADNVAYLKLERPAGDTGNPVLTLRLRADEAKPPHMLKLSLDGVPFPAEGRSLAATRSDDDVLSVVFSPEQAEGLIAAARKATKLGATVAGKTYEVSLAGAVAAMLWIDERQSRLNTPSALIRKGSAGSAPPAPALRVIEAQTSDRPALSEKDAKTLAAALRRALKPADRKACDDKRGTDADQAWPLRDNRHLVALACSVGAYNVDAQLWLVPGRDVAKARRLELRSGGGEDGTGVTNADFNPAKGELRYFAKGRGIGDCGVVGAYAWTGNGFVQSALSIMGECRMVGWDDWITLYRSEIRAK